MCRSEICYPKKTLENYNSLKRSYSDFTERISNDCNLELREEGSLPIFSNVIYVGPSVPHVLHRRGFEGVYQARTMVQESWYTHQSTAASGLQIANSLVIFKFTKVSICSSVTLDQFYCYTQMRQVNHPYANLWLFWQRKLYNFVMLSISSGINASDGSIIYWYLCSVFFIHHRTELTIWKIPHT